MEDEGIQEISGEVVVRKFAVSLSQLVDLVESYRNRKFDDDISMLKHKFEGIDALSDKLKTNTKSGIDETTVIDREVEFGSNRKDPPKISGF